MKKQSGMTLLEMLIATSILGVILVMVMAFMSTVAESAGIVNQVTVLEQEGSEVAEAMAENLRSGGNVSLSDSGGTITFQIPVDDDGDQDVFGDDLAIRWGVKREDQLDAGNEPKEYQGLTMQYRFVKTDSYSESGRGVDLNGDNDTTDVYDVGYMEEYYPAGTGNRGSTSEDLPEFKKALIGDRILRLPGEAIFVFNDTNVEISLRLAMTGEGEPIPVTMNTAAQIRNMVLPQPAAAP